MAPRSVGCAQCGLWLRSVAEHAAAAWLASRSASHVRCAEIDSANVWEVCDATSATTAAIQHLNTVLPDAARLSSDQQSYPEQRKLSHAIEERQVTIMLEPEGGI